jgi:hypothetical protein
MNAKQLKEIVDNSNISSCESMKQSIRKRMETAAYNGFYHIIFDHRSYDGPFLLPESTIRKFRIVQSEGSRLDKGWIRGRM